MLSPRTKKNILLHRNASPARENKKIESMNLSKDIFSFLTAVFLGVTLYILFDSDLLEIKNISVKGNQTISSSDILEKISALTQENYPLGISRKNYLFFSERQLEDGLKSNFRKIKKASVRKIFPDALFIDLEERSALIVRCAGEECHIIDEDGYAYEIADPNSFEIRATILIKLMDSKARKIEVGEKILSHEYVMFLIKLREILAQEGIEIENEWMMPSLVAEEVEIKNREGWRMYFSSRINPAKSVRILKLFLKEEIKEEKIDKIEYVDLRAENKIYYKLKDTEKEEEKNKPDLQTEKKDNEHNRED